MEHLCGDVSHVVKFDITFTYILKMLLNFITQKTTKDTYYIYKL